MTGRSDFLARFARVIQHYDLVAPEPIPVAAPESAKAKAEPKAPVKKARPMVTPAPASAPVPVPAPVRAAAPEPLGPMAGRGGFPPLAGGIEPDGEKATIGFAELLFQSPPPEPAKRAGFWGQGASADLAGGRVGGWGIEEPDTSPWWLKAVVFFAGSMMLGAVCAHLSGQAQWQKTKPHTEPSKAPVVAPPGPGGGKPRP